MHIKSPFIYDTMLYFFERLCIRRWRRRLWSEVSGKSILEAGAGTGLNMDFYGSHDLTTLVDIEAAPLQKARRRSTKKRIQAEFTRGDVENLPFPDNSFDAVVASFLFCSTAHPARGLAELHRVLKKGGKIFLLEHVRAPGKIGRVMDVLSWPLYRLFNEHIARETDIEIRRQGFVEVEVVSLMLDVIKLIKAEKPMQK